MPQAHEERAAEERVRAMMAASPFTESMDLYDYMKSVAARVFENEGREVRAGTCREFLADMDKKEGAS